MRYTLWILFPACLSMMMACSPAQGDRTGHEFMPDMVHTTGYEANLYNFYHFNRWGTKEDYKTYVNPRTGVPGTVARGEVAMANAPDDVSRIEVASVFTGERPGSIAMHPNGRVPYYYQNTEEERLRATREIRKNPFPITEAGLLEGKYLYNIYCGICHGVKGDGLGYLVREEDPAKGIIAGVYPAAPANFLLDTFVNTSVGRLYHAIMYGKNVMGPYDDKLSYKERWEVIHYIRSLQAQAKKLEYAPTANTFNAEALPWTVIAGSMKKEEMSSVRDTLIPHGMGTQDQHQMNQH